MPEELEASESTSLAVVDSPISEQGPSADVERRLDAFRQALVAQREKKVALGQKIALADQLKAEILELNEQLAGAIEDTTTKRLAFNEACKNAGLDGHA
jgi:hypothetical protein